MVGVKAVLYCLQFIVVHLLVLVSSVYCILGLDKDGESCNALVTGAAAMLSPYVFFRVHLPRKIHRVCCARLVGGEGIPPRAKRIGVGVQTDAGARRVCDMKINKSDRRSEGELVVSTDLRRGRDCAGLRSRPTDVSLSACTRQASFGAETSHVYDSFTFASAELPSQVVKAVKAI